MIKLVDEVKVLGKIENSLVEDEPVFADLQRVVFDTSLVPG
jgi:hypothetical protein